MHSDGSSLFDWQISRLMQSVMDQTPDSVFIKDLEGRYRLVNHAALKFVGRPVEQIIGWRDDAIFDAEGAAYIIERDREVIEQGIPLVGEEKLTSGGVEKVYWVTKSPLRDESGRVVGILGIAHDITERKRTERALLESEKRYRQLTEMLPEAIYVNFGGRITFCNPACVRLFGAPNAAEILGKTPFDLFHPRHHPEIRERIDRMLASGEPAEPVEQEVVRFDGKQVPVQVFATPISEHGEGATLVTMHDLTEQRRVERQLRHQQLMIKEAAELAHVGGWSFDPNTYEGDWTPETARIHDMPPDAPMSVAQGVNSFSGEDLAKLQNGLRNAIERGQPYDFELQMTTVKGNRKWVRAICNPLVDGGQVIRVRGSLQDITSRKEYEREIQSLNADLECRVKDRTERLVETNRELEAFTYSVSHDLRAPLRVIHGMSRILREDYQKDLPAAAHELISDICANTERMEQLIEGLLEFSQLGRHRLSKEPIDMTDLVNECLRELGRIPENNGTLDVARLPPCDGDRNLMKHVWKNLLDNALKYTAKVEHPRIRVSAEVLPGEVVYRVQDNGVGFDMRFAKRLFGVFQRFHGSDEFEGTGVGLAIVQRVVQRHQGRIWAEAAPNQGATFFFSMPLESIQ